MREDIYVIVCLDKVLRRQLFVFAYKISLL